MLDAVLSEAGDEAFHILVPYHFADIEVLVAAVSRNLALLKKAAGGVAEFLKFIPDCLVGGSCGALLILGSGCVVGALCIPDAVVKVLESVHV